MIVKLSLVAAVALGAFVVQELITAAPLVNLRLLLRRNFGLGTAGNFLLGFALYGPVYLLPECLTASQHAGDGCFRGFRFIGGPMRSRASIRFISSGTSGINTSCGSYPPLGTDARILVQRTSDLGYGDAQRFGRLRCCDQTHQLGALCASDSIPFGQECTGTRPEVHHPSSARLCGQ